MMNSRIPGVLIFFGIGIIIFKKMSLKKGLYGLMIFFLCMGLLFSQSLVELSKKEKKRRAQYKGKKVVEVTNADLKKFKKNPSIVVTQLSNPPSPSVFRPDALWLQSQKNKKQKKEEIRKLRERREKLRESVHLLTVKINSLNQKFYSFRDWTLRENIKKERSETYQKLQKAKQEKKEIEEKLQSYGIRTLNEPER